MKQLYNEGRVVGLSQYEIYVRQLLSTNPGATPMTEREWLTNTLATNTSMILRVPAGTEVGYHDFPLPTNSALAGCTVLYATLFQGDIIISDDGHWATGVYDYGELISNTNEVHPESPGESQNVPTKPDPEPMPQRLFSMSMNYLKIASALYLQPGEWSSNIYWTNLATEGGADLVTEDDEELIVPQLDGYINMHLDPDFTRNGFIRILVSDYIDTDVLILIHGFVDKVMLTGEVSFQPHAVSDRPQDGDFLGPAMYPWACPIELGITTDVENALTFKIENSIKTLQSIIGMDPIGIA